MVKLIKMSEIDFEAYLKQAITSYAAEKVKAGTWCEQESVELAQQAFNSLLTQGLETVQNYLFTINDTKSNEKVGYLWFKENQNFNGQ